MSDKELDERFEAARQLAEDIVEVEIGELTPIGLQRHASMQLNQQILLLVRIYGELVEARHRSDGLLARRP